MFTSINPATGKKIGEYKPHSKTQVESIIQETHKEWEYWRSTPFSFRSVLLEKTASLLIEKKEDLSMLMVQEMGKPIKQARSEIEKCAWVCRYYAENSEKFLQAERVQTDARSSYILYQPLGVILAIMPWNFPFWQVFRFAAPALMAGNTGLLKHASNVMGCAMAIENIFEEAGFPSHIFRTLRIKGSEVSPVIENPLVKAVTLTGSVEAGKAVAQKAGEHLKKTVLELGGSDPYLILEDADLELAAEKCTTSRLINNGQSCIAAKRFIVADKIFEKFQDLFLMKMKKIQMGDPHDENNDMGPQASVKLRNELHDQVTNSIEKGAECLLGGTIPIENGAWYPPTILSGVKPGMPAWEEELFGPVAAIIRAKDTDDAIRIANSSKFGLGSAIFSQNHQKAIELANHKLEAGCCFVNDFVKSDPRLPFGGIKQSGYGRELSHHGIREFVNIKSVWIK
ncbi:MAG: NAD-dependent succinate-semialdehyde dehydrogenase [Bacteroidales bacterium]